jgi:multisubunit Na+/H+ antiporter MnhC subunit
MGFLFKKSFLASVGIFCLFLAGPVLAANLNDAFQVDDTHVGGNPSDRLDNLSNAAGYNIQSPANGGVTVESLINTGITAIFGLLGVVFVSLVIYGGIRWMNAGGNDKEVQESKDIITQALIGLAVVVAASAISYFVINIFTAKTDIGTISVNQ